MDKKRLDYYKKKLQVRREELMKTIARTQEEGRTADEDPTVDLADKAANSYTKEFLFGMTNTDRTILNMIDAALKRITRMNTACARTARKSCSRSGSKRYRGPNTASPARRRWNKGCCKPTGYKGKCGQPCQAGRTRFKPCL